MKIMSSLQKPGENPRIPGEYLETGPFGGKVSRPIQVTLEPGDKPLPPTSAKGNKWKWVGRPKS